MSGRRKKMTMERKTSDIVTGFENAMNLVDGKVKPIIKTLDIKKDHLK